MYRLWIANKNYSSWSLRPWALLRQLDIPFEERLVRFDGMDNRAAFRDFSPSGQVPCLQDGDTTVWESLAIVEYLAERHEGVWPADPVARAWARCAAAEMHAGFGALRNSFGMSCGLRIRPHAPAAPVLRDLARIGELWGQGLDRFAGPFLAGAAFTAVDAFFLPVAFRLQTYGLDLAGPRAAAYATRLLDLPATRDWYAAALAEDFREPQHEAEALAAGEVLEDLRVPAAS